MKLKTRDGEYGLAIQFGVIESIEKVNGAGTRGGETNAEFACGFRISAGHEGGRLFVSYLDELDFVLASAESFHDSVDTVSGQAKNVFNSPTQQSLNKNVGGGHGGS